jgi:hypothetical protein
MWSTHSRRIEPINRSAKAFCQGEAGAVGFAKPPPLGLTELLKTKRAGYFGRIDILQRIGDGDTAKPLSQVQIDTKQHPP